MGRHFRCLVVVALAFAWVGCQSFKVRSDWDPAVPFSSFGRYVWVEPPAREEANPFADNTLLRGRVRAAVEDALSRRGFRSQESRAGAHFLVTYHVVLEEQFEFDTLPFSSGYYHRRHHAFGAFHSIPRAVAFQESSLVIDFLDPRTDDLVWRGWASGILGTRDRIRSLDVLDRGVEAILNAFPPRL
jgi:hypothetical protein